MYTFLSYSSINKSALVEKMTIEAQNKGRATPIIAKVAVVEEHSGHLLSGVCTTVTDGYTVGSIVGYTSVERTKTLNQIILSVTEM